MVYFASDIHLGAGSEAAARDTERRFVAWLDRVGADARAIVLAGDLFDFWFEYRRVVPKGFVRTLSKLAELSERGIRVVFLPGNHDMWVSDYLARECGVEIHAGPCVLDFDGQRLFVAHGDNMNVGRKPLLKVMNAAFRSRLLRWLFSWGVHPDLALGFGRWWSSCSRKSHAKEGGADISVIEPLVAYAREHAAALGVDRFVFGHMHFAADHCEEGLHTLHLGSWDRCASYGVLDDEGRLSLKTTDS